jgi:hypothetical protein
MTKTLLTAVISIFVAAGCKKHEPAPATTGSSGSAGSAMVAAGSAAGSGSAMTGSATPTAAATEVPTSADFEAGAKTDITDKNLDTQLGAIEKDLSN